MAGVSGAVGRAGPEGRDPGRLVAGGQRARPLVRSAGLLPTQPLSPFVPLPRPCPRRGSAGRSRSPEQARLALERGSPPRRASELRASLPGDPPSCAARRLPASPELPLLLDRRSCVSAVWRRTS